MTKHFFKSLTIILLGLFAGGNMMQAKDQKMYVAALQAQSSPASTGTGLVKLTWLDIKGVKMASEIAMDVQATNPVGPDATVQSLCATMFAMDGVEVDFGDDEQQAYMTSRAYFQAEGIAENGSYLDGWTFTDPRISRLDTIGAASGGVYFKLLPDTNNYAYYHDTDPASYDHLDEAKAAASANPNNIYAVFKKYLLFNPVVYAGGQMLDAEEDAYAEFGVSVDVEGDIAQLKEDFADFVFPTATFSEDEYGAWTWELDGDPSDPFDATEQLSATKLRVYFIITFTAKSEIQVDTYKATFTIGMAGANASVLNIPVSVSALDPDRPEALLLDGKTEKTSGDLSTMLSTDISTYDNPILRLNKDCGDLTLSGKTFTLDLNGNYANSITVNSGEVTIAYSKFGGYVNEEVSVTGGKLILNGGDIVGLTIGANGTVEQNGANVETVANHGTLTTTNGTIAHGLVSNGTLTLNGGSFYNGNGDNAIEISGGTANINRGTIVGTNCGLLVSGGTATVKKLAAISSEGDYSAMQTGTGVLNVECGKFGKPLNGTINFTSGYFTNQNYGVPTTGKTEMLVSAGVEYNEGYRYFLGTTESAAANGVGVCRIGNVSYATLEDALAYANNNPDEELVIFMTNDYTLPAGYYTLPAKATLTIPMSDTQDKEINTVAPRVSFHDLDRSHPYVVPTEFRRLTFASGVNLEVFGDIELTCSQFASNEAYTSQPYGPYGHLVMEAGSHMTLQSGSEVRAWGFITGAGETDARRGSKVREMFQMGDWKGAMTSVKITGMAPSIVADNSEYKIFPVTQYFIQNVESPVKYHPGAVLSTSAAVSEGIMGYLAVSMAATDIKVIGVSGTDDAIFLMDIAADADNTWVRKWYDAVNDVQVYDINSGAHIGSMVLDMGELDISAVLGVKLPVKLNSAHFDLPITSNMKIHLLSGTMDFKQNTCLLPGAEVEVDKESIVSVAMSSEEKIARDNNENRVYYTGALYVYDSEDWDKYAFCNVAEYDVMSDKWTERKDTAYTKVVRYAQSWGGTPTIHNEQTRPEDAAINVHGTFNTADGYVYTSEHGANIFSSNEDAGTFIFNQDAFVAGTRNVYQVKDPISNSFGGRMTNILESAKTFYSAKLKNGNGTYENTDAAIALDAYCYKENLWTIMKVDEDDECFMVDNHGTYYAKPSEYVALANGKTENADHTYSDKAGEGRLFILVNGNEECQWWEVEQRDNLYYCAKSDMYYYYDEDDLAWTEKRFKITWKNWDGTIVQTANADGLLQNYDMVKYGTMAEFLGTNPTREASADYTYDFMGWSPELGPVTKDVTYTATYTTKERKYTIIFLNEGGTEIERQFLTLGASPVCENMPMKVGHILQWVPSIAPVAGDAEYTATWLEEPPTTWDITFMNYDGSVLKKSDGITDAVYEVPAGSTDLAYEGAVPTKVDPLSEYNFTFAGWKGLDGNTYTTELPAATENATYVAQFTPEIKKYTICYFMEDGSTPNPTKASELLAYGAMPTPPVVTKENPADGYVYTLVWKNLAETGTIQTVQGEASYKPTYIEEKQKYTITLIANPSGACSFSGAGIYEYGEDVDIAAIYDGGKYNFLRWSDDVTDAVRAKQTVTGNITYTAYLEEVPEMDLEIAANGSVTLDAPITKNNLIITSNGVTSGQLIGADNLTLTGNAYFDLNINAAANTWYAVAVPWEVAADGGIMVSDIPLVINSNCYVLTYNSLARASEGGSRTNWTFEGASLIMQPGTLYMIYLTSPATTIRFKKRDGADLSTTSLNVQEYPSANPLDAGWNGIANPALYYAFLNASANTYSHANFGQKYIPIEDRYEAINMKENKLVVGAPIFVQVAANKLVAAETNNGGFAAPARKSIVNDSYYEVRIAADADFTDRIYLQTMEDKEDQYVIGLDLAKAGVSTKVAQMWVDRYNAKLCVNTTAPIGSSATYPLGIFAPQDGDYQIYSATEMQSGQEMYVTLNGRTIWNLAYGPYTATLTAGNHTEYGLKLIQAPATPTGVDNVQGDDVQGTKVIIDDHIYIIRGGEVYTITGQKVQ